MKFKQFTFLGKKLVEGTDDYGVPIPTYKKFTKKIKLKNTKNAKNRIIKAYNKNKLNLGKKDNTEFRGFLNSIKDLKIKK